MNRISSKIQNTNPLHASAAQEANKAACKGKKAIKAAIRAGKLKK